MCNLLNTTAKTHLLLITVDGKDVEIIMGTVDRLYIYNKQLEVNTHGKI